MGFHCRCWWSCNHRKHKAWVKGEIDIAMIGRDAMEKAIADRFPDSELRDTWVWFQSGINTDGAHNPVTTRTLRWETFYP